MNADLRGNSAVGAGHARDLLLDHRPLAQGRAADARTRQGSRRGLVYERHRPEETQLYRLVEQYYPAFVEHLSEQGMSLPAIPPNPRSGR